MSWFRRDFLQKHVWKGLQHVEFGLDSQVNFPLAKFCSWNYTLVLSDNQNDADAGSRPRPYWLVVPESCPRASTPGMSSSPHIRHRGSYSLAHRAGKLRHGEVKRRGWDVARVESGFGGCVPSLPSLPHQPTGVWNGTGQLPGAYRPVN